MLNHSRNSLFILAAALLLLVLAPSASATTVESEAGKALPSGTSFTGESEGKTVLHPPIGSIECGKSHVGGKTTNAGGAGVNVTGTVETLSFSECNSTVTVLNKGTGSLSSSGGSNGTLTSSGTEVTMVFAGFHCVFKTNNTSLGTVTGGTNATLDVSATIPRTGGSSGVFCGSTAAFTGSYKGSAPSPLNVTG